MLLIIGDSYVHWARTRCDLGSSVRTAGWRGGCLTSDSFRRWAVRTVRHIQPRRVLLVAGGNDVAQQSFSPRILSQIFEELTAGLIAAGAKHVFVFAIPPRSRTRPGDASVSAYRKRRKLMNQILTRQFSKPEANPDVSFIRFQPAAGFIGRDGIHPSPEGWRCLEQEFRAAIPPLSHHV